MGQTRQAAKARVVDMRSRTSEGVRGEDGGRAPETCRRAGSMGGNGKESREGEGCEYSENGGQTRVASLTNMRAGGDESYRCEQVAGERDRTVRREWRTEREA